MEYIIADIDGEFTPVKHIGSVVAANDRIGMIYYGGIMNDEFTDVAGTIVSILPDGTQVSQNETRLCSIDTTKKTSVIA